MADKKKTTKVRVRAVMMIWNGRSRIREGTVFDYELEEGKKLPRSLEAVDEPDAEKVDLGKRERGNQPTNLVKDIPLR